MSLEMIALWSQARARVQSRITVPSETPSAIAVSSIERAPKKAKLNYAAIDNDWPVNFSIGMVTFASPPIDVDEMLRAADQLMYSVKRERKSRLAPAAS